MRLEFLHDQLLSLADKYRWSLEAWAVFLNHIHFVGKSPAEDANAASLIQFMSELHTSTSTFINKIDGTPGRKNWHNYRETRLTYEKSYFARLNYVHQNAVKHQLVPVANQYPWSSARWFEINAKPAHVKTIYSFKTDAVKVFDEFEPASDF